MARIAKLTCIDEGGLPRRDRHGQPTEPELTHAGIPYRFAPGEAVYLKAEIAHFLAQRSKGRLRVSRAVESVEVVIIDDEIIMLEKGSGRPLKLASGGLPPDALKAGDPLQSGSVNPVPDKIPLPPESLDERLRQLSMGAPDATIE
jgi:hypothetical protein